MNINVGIAKHYLTKSDLLIKLMIQFNALNVIAIIQKGNFPRFLPKVLRILFLQINQILVQVVRVGTVQLAIKGTQ